MIQDDNAILRIWKDDPTEGFRLLYARYSGSLLRFVYRFTGNKEQAEEILHEIFTEAFHADFSDLNFNVKGWLFTVARNKSLNFERRKKFEMPSEARVQAAIDPHHLEDAVSDNQALLRLEQYQRNLPSDLAEAWKLRRQGQDYAEIATTLGIPLGTVKSRFHRLVEHFKKEFKLENND